MQAPFASSTLLGTTTGVLLTLAVNLSTQQLANTMVLTALGAATSFIVSLLLKWLAGQLRKRK